MLTFTRIALGAGVLVPIVYFGSQLAAAPFYPGYSFLVNSASQLGSDASQRPEVLNTGAILTGLTSLVASVGFYRGLVAVGGHRLGAVLSAACAVSTGVAAIWAGSFPLPDPRHNPGVLGAGTFIAPLALLLALWPVQAARPVRTYLIATLATFVALTPIMAGLTPLDPQRFPGLMQRIVAVALYLPPAVVAAFLLNWASKPRHIPNQTRTL